MTRRHGLLVLAVNGRSPPSTAPAPGPPARAASRSEHGGYSEEQCRSLTERLTVLPAYADRPELAQQSLAQCLAAAPHEPHTECVLAATRNREVAECMGMPDELAHAMPSEIKYVITIVETYVAHAHAFPRGKEPLGPNDSCCTTQHKVCPPESLVGSVWKQLSLAMPFGFRFHYSYEGGGETATIIAEGDDCDGKTATYRYTAHVHGDDISALIVKVVHPK